MLIKWSNYTNNPQIFKELEKKKKSLLVSIDVNNVLELFTVTADKSDSKGINCKYFGN